MQVLPEQSASLEQLFMERAATCTYDTMGLGLG